MATETSTTIGPIGWVVGYDENDALQLDYPSLLPTRAAAEQDLADAPPLADGPYTNFRPLAIYEADAADRLEQEAAEGRRVLSALVVAFEPDATPAAFTAALGEARDYLGRPAPTRRRPSSTDEEAR